MTVEELMQELAKCSPDAIVMYRHNKYGRVDIDEIKYEQELMYSGGYIRTVTLEGTYEEDKDVVSNFFEQSNQRHNRRSR